MLLKLGYWASAFNAYILTLYALMAWQAGARPESAAFAALGVCWLAGGVGLRNYMRKERA